MKGAKKRIGVFKAEQEGGFAQFHAALFQIMMGEFAARLFNDLLKGDACIGKSALQRARSHAKFSPDILQRRTLPRQ